MTQHPDLLNMLKADMFILILKQGVLLMMWAVICSLLWLADLMCLQELMLMISVLQSA